MVILYSIYVPYIFSSKFLWSSPFARPHSAFIGRRRRGAGASRPSPSRPRPAKTRTRPACRRRRDGDRGTRFLPRPAAGTAQARASGLSRSRSVMSASTCAGLAPGPACCSAQLCRRTEPGKIQHADEEEANAGRRQQEARAEEKQPEAQDAPGRDLLLLLAAGALNRSHETVEHRVTPGPRGASRASCPAGGMAAAGRQERRTQAAQPPGDTPYDRGKIRPFARCRAGGAPAGSRQKPRARRPPRRTGPARRICRRPRRPA